MANGLSQGKHWPISCPWTQPVPLATFTAGWQEDILKSIKSCFEVPLENRKYKSNCFFEQTSNSLTLVRSTSNKKITFNVLQGFISIWIASLIWYNIKILLLNQILNFLKQSSTILPCRLYWHVWCWSATNSSGNWGVTHPVDSVYRILPVILLYSIRATTFHFWTAGINNRSCTQLIDTRLLSFLGL